MLNKLNKVKHLVDNDRYCLFPTFATAGCGNITR